MHADGECASFAAMTDSDPLPLSSSPYLVGAGGPDSRLVAEVCEDCGERVFPPAGVCPACAGERMKPLMLAGRGRVYSFSVLRQPPPGFEAPSVVAYVDMPEGVRIFSRIEGAAPEAVSCGMEVAMRPVEGRIDRYGRKVARFVFVPV